MAYVEKIKLQKPETQIKKVVGYCRISTEKENSIHSLSAQINYFITYIQQHPNWLYCGIYADKLSGTKERPEFQRMLTDCRAGKIDLVITKSISRFARNTVTLLETVRELKFLGVDVYFEEQNIHSISSEGELMLTILASFAQAESQSASENMKWRAKHAFENGELFNLHFMFGYNISNNNITINETEADIVREIYQRVIEGQSLSGIARNLNKRNIHGAFDKEWRPERIKRLVQNEKYCGNALLQKRFRNNYIEKKLIPNTGQMPMYFAEDTHPAIVDDETFRLANEALTQIIHTQKEPKKEHEFTGIISCPYCGKNYRRIRSKHTGKFAWNCSTYVSKGNAYCHGKAIPEEILIQVTTDTLKLETFSKSAMAERIERIIIPGDNQLVFVFKDGTHTEKTWRSYRKSPNKEV